MMKKTDLGKTGFLVPSIAVGCMRISEMSKGDLQKLVNTAVENGANFFDHADIYGAQKEGDAEIAFADAVEMNSGFREKNNNSEQVRNPRKIF